MHFASVLCFLFKISLHPSKVSLTCILNKTRCFQQHIFTISTIKDLQLIADNQVEENNANIIR